MKQIWRLLSDEEISALSPEDLSEYRAWLKLFTKQKKEEKELYKKKFFDVHHGKIRDKVGDIKVILR